MLWNDILQAIILYDEEGTNASNNLYWENENSKNSTLFYYYLASQEPVDAMKWYTKCYNRIWYDMIWYTTI